MIIFVTDIWKIMKKVIFKEIVHILFVIVI